MEPENDNLCASFPELMTEDEVIQYLRIPAISKSKNYHNVVANLKHMRRLPCIYICRQPLYPRETTGRWIEQQTEKEQR